MNTSRKNIARPITPKLAPRQAHLHAQLQDQLDDLKSRHLLRQLKPVTTHGPMITLEDGRELVNLASNDYLGLSQHPHLISAACQSIQQSGTGSGASRLVSGHGQAHQSFEIRFARFKHAESALLFPTGYMANLGVLTALVRKGDVIFADKLCHASLIDAARAAAAGGATLRVFPHLGYDKLERLLERPISKLVDSEGNFEGNSGGNSGGGGRRFIVTDSVFSMDGDTANLPLLCDLADRHDAILIVDEAHGTGVLGDTGSGLCEMTGVTGRVDIVISTASKALGSLGGIVTASDVTIQTLVNHARSIIYTTAAGPWHPVMIDAALDVIESEPWRRKRVIELAAKLRKALAQIPPFNTTSPTAETNTNQQTEHARDSAIVTPIVPVITGDALSAQTLSDYLASVGFYAPAIRPPTVAPGSARVRLSLRADMEDDHLDRLIEALCQWSG